MSTATSGTATSGDASSGMRAPQVQRIAERNLWEPRRFAQFGLAAILWEPVALAGARRRGHESAMPPLSRVPALLSLIAAMTLTGANVAFAKAIAAEFPVYVFVLFRFAVASAALALMVGSESGPKLRAMTGPERRDLVLMALLGMVGFTVLMFEGL